MVSDDHNNDRKDALLTVASVLRHPSYK
jgi:hypothetical protein